MAVKGLAKLDRLLATLNSSETQKNNPALYQVISELIKSVRQLTAEINEDINNLPVPPSDIINENFLTSTDETGILPNSRVLVAGTNITLDLATPGQEIINASGGGSVTLVGEGSYLQLDEPTQVLTKALIDLASDVSGTLAPEHYLHNLLSNSHPDTVPFSPPVIGDVIVAAPSGELPDPGVYGGGGWLNGSNDEQLTAGKGILSSWLNGEASGFLNAFPPVVYTYGLWTRKGSVNDRLFTVDGSGNPDWRNTLPTLTGNISTSGNITELSRSAPMGYWTPVPFNAANFTASPGTWPVVIAKQIIYSYTLIGKTLILTIEVVNSSVTGTPTFLIVQIPGGFFPKYNNISIGTAIDNSVHVVVEVAVQAFSSSVFIIKADGTNWATAVNTTSVYFTLTFETT